MKLCAHTRRVETVADLIGVVSSLHCLRLHGLCKESLSSRLCSALPSLWGKWALSHRHAHRSASATSPSILLCRTNHLHLHKPPRFLLLGSSIFILSPSSLLVSCLIPSSCDAHLQAPYMFSSRLPLVHTSTLSCFYSTSRSLMNISFWRRNCQTSTFCDTWPLQNQTASC